MANEEYFAIGVPVVAIKTYNSKRDLLQQKRPEDWFVDCCCTCSRCALSRSRAPPETACTSEKERARERESERARERERARARERERRERERERERWRERAMEREKNKTNVTRIPLTTHVHLKVFDVNVFDVFLRPKSRQSQCGPEASGARSL